jgi:enamine deaminase RidA (YjgF/YER057c/UK114 family)
MPNQYLNPDAVSRPTNYTHVVVGQGSRVVFISGQVAVDSDGKVVGEGDLELQADKVFENLKACLAGVGASFSDVTKLTTFVVNYRPEHRAIIGGVRQRHLPAENPPASTLVGVQALALPELMIEIEAVAVLP